MERHYAGAHPDYDFHGMLVAERRKEKKRRETIRKKMEDKSEKKKGGLTYKTKTAKKVRSQENPYLGHCSEKHLDKEGPVNQEQEQSKTPVQEKEVMDKRSKELCRRGREDEVSIEEPQLRGRQEPEEPQHGGGQEQVEPRLRSLEHEEPQLSGNPLPLCRKGQVLQWASSLWGRWGVEAWLHCLPQTACRYCTVCTYSAVSKHAGNSHFASQQPCP